MEYIVLDMEWNQALNFSEMVKDPVFLTGEIIQIGAIKLNQTLEVVDSFNERIAPQYYGAGCCMEQICDPRILVLTVRK